MSSFQGTGHSRVSAGGILKSMSRSMNKVLVIEDEPALSKVIKNKLTAEGYAVSVLPNGVDVVPFLSQEKPAVVLLDLVMPKVDGFSVLKQLKADPSLQDIVVVVLSNLSQDTDVDEVLVKRGRV